jgi:hypothetical protein
MSPHGLALASPEPRRLLSALQSCLRVNPELSGLVSFRVAGEEIWIIKTGLTLED